MERYKAPYTLLRPSKNRKYWRFRLADDPTRSARSTGQVRKSDAIDWIEENVLGKSGTKSKDTPLLRTYALPAFDEYVESRRKLRKPLTELYVERRRKLIEKYILKDPIANMRLGDIKLADSERFRDRLLEKSKQNQPTVKLVLSAYRWIVGRAAKRGIIDRDPALGMDNPKLEQRQRAIYTVEEINTLFKADVWKTGEFKPWDGAEDYTAFLLALCTGMRKGEILGLSWSCVHLDADKEHIEIKVQLNDKGEIVSPKSKRPRATPIFDFVLWPKERRAVRALKELRKLQISRNKIIEMDSPVFGYVDGSYRKGTWWNKHLMKALQTAKINRDRGEDLLPLDAHSLRHSLASHLKAVGIPSDYIRLSCGWATEQIQAAYTHFDPDLFGRIMKAVKAVSAD